VPQFGGFAADSALNFGFAILSDIEVFFLLQAAKGDQRSNVTQAPTVTMFNGQSASVFDGQQRPFVTSITPVVGDFAAAQQPVITILPEGVQLNVRAVVSPDRRFVKMTLVPFFSQITDVDTFQFEGERRIRRGGGTDLQDILDIINGNANDDDGLGADELEIVESGTTVQLPTFANTTITTTVSVPDGGTVLLGGIKSMSEGRNEAGVPFLSNIPYINRLFKNVGIGRETSSLMMMVTPRIIIQEEEEQNQVINTGG
jgi:general secretion pathway protein D